MIHFHAARRFCWTMATFIQSWDKALAKDVTVTAYEDIDPREPVPAGLHLFTDFERLLAPELAHAQRLHDRMLEHPESYAVLGSPRAWLPRLELNQALSAAGINDYRAFRLGDVPDDLAFPAFVRWGNDHRGSLGEPVTSHREIAAQVADHASGWRRAMRRHLLVIEQLDPRGPDGLYRKYSAQKIGDRIIPRHLFFSHLWVTKHSELVTEPMLEEELAFLDDFPHEREVEEVFALGGVDYGRMDYGFVDGRMQVWEINTNPVLAKRRKKIEPGRMPGQRASVEAMAARLRELSAIAPTGPARRLLGPLEAARWRAVTAALRPYERHRR